MGRGEPFASLEAKVPKESKGKEPGFGAVAMAAALVAAAVLVGAARRHRVG